MNTKLSTKHKFNRMLVDILSVFIILAIAFPATGSAYAEESTPFSGRDEFDGSLTEGWYWVNENEDKWEFNDGFLRVYASPYGTGGENLLLRPVAAGDFMIKTHLLFEPDTNFQIAGLVIWQDEENFLQLGHAFCDVDGPCVGNGLYFDQAEDGNPVGGNFGTSINEPSDVFLRLERRGDMVRAFYSADHGISWYEIGTHWIPSDFQVNGVGLTASQDFYTPDRDVPADFDFFELTEGRGFLPEGFHDFDSGDVPNWACNAGGWAADPDDRSADVNIEIVVDDQTVANLVTGEFRQDLLDAGVCVDGNCSFSTSLWDLISSYEPHRVDIWAQDDTGEWVLLSNSAKTLTCRTYDIYTYDPMIGETRQITNLRDMHEFNPRWSPDAKKIVHDAWSIDWGSHGIYITDVKTGVSTPLAGADRGSYPTWSPSGKWIAFDRGADEDYRLFILPPAGGTPRPVAEDAFMATWAPNGNRLAFHRPSDGGIWTTDLDGENQTKVAERGNGPAWSPDGEWIAFEVDGDVWKVRVNNGGIPRGEPIQLTSSPLWEGRPTWSYNSKTIAFHAGMGQDTDIWTIPAAGGMATWLTGAPNFGDYDANYSLKGQSTAISYASFSPDGQAARNWISNFSYDVGTWSEGEHNYHFETTYSVPEPWSGTSDPITFTVASNARSYNGYVLLRTFALRARVGSGCPAVNPLIRPEQNTRFSYGWQTDYPMTYAEAVAHFNTLAVQAHWDDGMSVDLQRQEIFSLSAVDFGEIVCASTEAPPLPVLYIHYEYPDVVEGDYELGHTVEVTVFDSEWNTKATATVETMEMPHWGGAPGFRVEQWDGMEGPPDIQPGDVVRAVVDGGPLTVETQIGEIIGTIDIDANTITGTINAPWAGDLVNVMCSPWGAPHGAPDKETTVVPDGVSEFTCTWDSSEWDIQPGETVGVSYWGNDLHSIANAISNPWIVAFPEANQVFGYGWPVGSEVNLTVNDEDIATVTVEGAPWDPNDIMAFFDLGDMHDLVAGDVVKLSGSGMERTHAVQNLTVTDVNMETDTVSGAADPGATVHNWVHGFGYDVWLTVPEDTNTWEAYLGSPDFHLKPGMCGRAEIRVEGNNSTNVDWCLPNTRFTVWPEQNYLEGYEWPDGALVSISVAGKDACLSEAVSSFPEWDPSNTFFSVNFPEGCDVGVGDSIILSHDALSLTHEVQELAITEVNVDADMVAGTAAFDPEQYYLHTWIHGVDGSYMPLSAEGGAWLADFSFLTGGLQPGMGGRVELVDQDSNATAVEWYIPNPRFVVFPEWEWFDGNDWPDGATVDITVEGKPECTTSKESWGFFFNGSFDELGEGCNVVIGDTVTFTAGETIRTHTVRNLAITNVDQVSEAVSGTSDPNETVYVWQHEPGPQIPFKANEYGEWFADLNGYYDIRPGAGGRSEIRDEFGNSTAVDWYIPIPRIVVQITDDWFRAENFTPNGQLTFWIYDGQSEALLRHPENTWQLDGSGGVTIGMWELDEYLDLVPGNFLVVSDGTMIKELLLEAFTFDIFDGTIGYLQGTAPEPFGRTVWVGIGLENDAWTMEVTTDMSGNWSTDFGVPVPTDYQWVAAQIFDEDGDASELRPASQAMFLRPACGDTYTVQAGGFLEIRYGSWVAIGKDLAIQNAEHLTVELVLNGETVAGTQQSVVPRSEIPCGIPLENAFGVYYVASVDPLSPGTYVAEVTWIFDEPVTDGYDADGDGLPDWYEGEIAREFTLIVP